MQDTDKDLIFLALLIALLGTGGILQGRVLRSVSDQVRALQDDVAFLRAVARETEKRLAE